MAAKVRTVERAGLSLMEKLYLPEIIKGMGLTLGHFLRNFHDTSNIIVRDYPDQKVDIPQRWRGRHRLTTREDGTVKCVACFMCATNCPAKCIFIEATEREDGVTEKMPERFDIDLIECVYCGFCVEACPVDAIRMDTGIFSVVTDNREDMLISKEELMRTPGAFKDHAKEEE
ncbi:NuoI/complex I 23 kDa subunit family protein [Desulfurispira natronophila]|uniref:NADH-quinone oxidoreductase subunit I n=1 Tax=Desulfurispira natronophila TaxID=682562 RepID=A0A7W7Y470_9BACT|nr:NADH-quinone oxidoreductase subunit I [Desulfurispira natronophila]MBB5021760.1 NADH-quinone oxidoreductase subunit I [Desulfurispira natronophila]